MGGVVCPVRRRPVPLVALCRVSIYLPVPEGARRPMGRVLRIVRERARVYARFRRDST